MMGFNLESYETVKDRITRFYADHADGRILTELVTDPAALSNCAGFKAYVYIGEVIKATGYAYEDKGQGVNRDAWVENSETSAIGRALANMDYCGTLRPSREEMSKVGNDRQPERTAMNVRAELTLKARGQNVDEVKTWQASHGFPRDWERMTVAEAEELLKDFCESFGV